MFRGISLLSSKIYTQVASITVLLAAARLLTPDQFGVFALASALTMVLNQWVGVGTYEYVIQAHDEKNAPHTAFWINLATGAGFALLGLGVATFAGEIFRAPSLNAPIAVLAILAIPAGLRSVAESILVRDGRFHDLALATIASETIAGITALAALVHGAGMWALVLHKAVQFTIAPLVFAIAARWRPGFLFDRDIARRMLGLGAPLLGDRFLAYFQNYGADLAIGFFLSPTAVAYYRLAARILVAAQSVIGDTIRTVALRALAAARGEHSPSSQSAESVISAAYALSSGAFVGLALCAWLIVPVVLGETWMPAAPILAVMAMAALIGLPTLATEALCATSNRTRLLPALRIGVIAVSMPLLVMFAPHGPLWAAISQFISTAIVTIAVMVFQHRMFGVSPLRYAPSAARSLAGAGVMALVIGAVFAQATVMRLPPATVLIIILLAAPVTYGLFYHLLGRGEIQRLRALVSGTAN